MIVEQKNFIYRHKRNEKKKTSIGIFIALLSFHCRRALNSIFLSFLSYCRSMRFVCSPFGVFLFIHNSLKHQNETACILINQHLLRIKKKKHIHSSVTDKSAGLSKNINGVVVVMKQ